MSPMELAVETVAARAITVRKDGRALEISMLEAIVATLGQKAPKRGPHPTRQFIALNAEVEEKRRAIISEDIRIWTFYKERKMALV